MLIKRANSIILHSHRLVRLEKRKIKFIPARSEVIQTRIRTKNDDITCVHDSPRAMKDNISDGFISVMESHCAIFVNASDLRMLLCQHSVGRFSKHKLKGLKSGLTIECSQMLSWPGNFPILSTSADLDATWTSFANLAISREISSALEELPISTITCKIHPN